MRPTIMRKVIRFLKRRHESDHLDYAANAVWHRGEADWASSRLKLFSSLFSFDKGYGIGSPLPLPHTIIRRGKRERSVSLAS